MSWKFILVFVLVVVCVLSIWPPSQKLKLGIDLAGGTSLLYQIDTSDLGKAEKRDIAETMIRILRQRIDPSNTRNLVWRPHGPDRLEIQMPMPTKQTLRLHDNYKKALAALKAYNINERLVQQAMVQPTGMSLKEFRAKRDARFKQLAGASEKRTKLLTALAQAQDALLDGQAKLVQYLEAQEKLKKQCQAAKLPVASLDFLYQRWDKMDEPNRVEEIKKIAKDDAVKQKLVRDYMDIRKKLADQRNAVTGVDGLMAKYNTAWDNLRNANINIDLLEKYIALKNRKKRESFLTEIKTQHPDAAPLIDKLLTAYKAYSKVQGRLDDPESLKAKLRGSGVLEFRILPQVTDGNLTEGEIKTYIENLQKYGPKKASDDKYLWKKIKDPDNFRASKAIFGEFAGEKYVLTSNLPDECLRHETGPNKWRLQKATLGADQFGAPAVNFRFDPIGTGYFWDLTKNNINRPLCILLDDEAISAPNINTAIRGSGQITGQFTAMEAQDLVDKLNAGSLPARLSDQPIAENTVGPTLGHDNLVEGLHAGIYGLLVVAAFMLVYYMISGALADIALFMNLLIIIGVMAFTRSTFTMSGIAGVILTIGMAVDANVLVFERIREEQQRGASLRIAIKNGYNRAFRTILDANLTTFLVGLILWILASEEVKGFALTLMIGIISSMFTALFVTRMIFDFLTDRRILKNKISMLQIIKNAHVNWMGLRVVFGAISLLLVIGGWVVFLGRDEQTNSKYSIEFTGGTSVHVILTKEGADSLLTEKQKKLDVNARSLELRKAIEDAIRKVGKEMNDPLLEVAKVQRVGDPSQRMFEIVTTETNEVEVILDLGKDNKQTAEQIQAKLHQAALDIGDNRLADLTVHPGSQPGQFIMVTHQTNVNQINQAVDAALHIKLQPDQIKTKPIVNNAIRKALGNKLDVMTSLNPTISSSEPITDELIGRKPYLSDSVGGLYLKVDFGDGKTENVARLRQRIEQSRLMSDLDQYGDEPFKWFAPDDASITDQTKLNGVEIAVVSPDVIYDGSDSLEWRDFVKRQQKRFSSIFARETSLPRITQIDPSIGRESMNDAIIAIVISLLAIIAYIWIRFGNMRFGLAAVVALVHDVSIAMGMVAASAWLSHTAIGSMLKIQDFKIDLPMIAGFLTVIGYSLNDTIVVFDRIRENRGKLATLSPSLINDSINQTLSRTILTSLTTLMVLVVMYIWGGPGLRSFNYVLIIGIVVGTYSSIGIASPLLCLVNPEKTQKATATNANNKKNGKRKS